ncbi:hypothetical protein [Streptomyces djakartensis]
MGAGAGNIEDAVHDGDGGPLRDTVEQAGRIAAAREAAHAAACRCS